MVKALSQKQREISVEKNRKMGMKWEWKKPRTSSEIPLWSKALTLCGFGLWT